MMNINSVYIHYSLQKKIHPVKSTMASVKIKLFLIFGLTCFITSSSMKFLMSSNIDKEVLIVYQLLKKILNKCYHDRLNPLVMSNVVGQQLIDYSSLQHPISLILMDENFEHNETKAQWTSYYPNTSTFVIIINSFNQFQKIIKDIYLSVWNNNEPNFIVVDLNSCQNASGILNWLWTSNFLSTIFLCYNDLKDDVQFYTYNPFTDRAPYPWIKVENNQSWTLYQRDYKEDDDICLNLIYDKTKYLDGYKIKAVGIPKPGVKWISDMDYDLSSLTEKLPYFNAQFALNIFLKMNITPVINYNQTLQLEKNTFLLSSFSPSRFNKGVFNSYPFRQVPLVIITQKRPFLSAEDKILHFYSFLVILLVIISFGILFIALMFNKKQSCSSAILELMRILVSTGIQQPLNRLPLRIYLFGILWLVIILNSTFQGHLAKFLTRPERQSVDSIADLKNFKYKVYVNDGSYLAVKHTLSEMQQPAEIMKILNGYEVVLNNSQAAYITAIFRAYEPAYKHQLHVSDPCSFNYQYFVTSLPITKRIDEISSHYAESGLQDYWDNYAIDRYKTNLTNTEELETSPRLRPLTIIDILFMLKFLAIGLGISFIVFLLEIAIGTKNRKRIN